jgi:hypothetical protein
MNACLMKDLHLSMRISVYKTLLRFGVKSVDGIWQI